jgi:RimJ/RimL family protein N-acetyltransferase
VERHRRPREEAAPRHRAGRLVLTTPALRTERLDLEPVSPSHADEMVGVLADRALYACYDDEPSPTLEELRKRYARQASGLSPDGREVWHSWIVRERESGTAVGFLQATVGPTAGSSSAAADTVATPYDGLPSAELAWVIGLSWQGRGYATEAAAAVRDAVRGPGSVTGDDVTRVQAHIAPGHVASETVARHLGLTPTDVTHHGETRWLLTLSD